MKKILFLIFVHVGLCNMQLLQAQNVGINATGALPNSSAMLDVQSTTKGMLVPRMTTAQRKAIASPATGLLVFDNTTGSFWFKNASKWVELIDSSNTIWTKSGLNVYLNNGENVGIGNVNPDVRLQVSNGSDVSVQSGGFLQLGNSTAENLAMDNNEILARNNGNISDLYMQVNGGKVGIGTPNAEVKLQVNGGSDVSSTGGGYIQLGAGSSTNLAFDNNEMQARDNGTASSLFLQNSGGDLQLGSSAGSTTDVHINNGKLITPATGSANMMPLCYGSVVGNVLKGGTANVTVVKSSEGIYNINCPGITSSTILMGTRNDVGNTGSSVEIVYSKPGQATLIMIIDGDYEDDNFSFIFYNP